MADPRLLDKFSDGAEIEFLDMDLPQIVGAEERTNMKRPVVHFKVERTFQMI